MAYGVQQAEHMQQLFREEEAVVLKSPKGMPGEKGRVAEGLQGLGHCVA